MRERRWNLSSNFGVLTFSQGCGNPDQMKIGLLDGPTIQSPYLRARISSRPDDMTATPTGRYQRIVSALGQVERGLHYRRRS